jgi:hypothetical protein
MGLKERNNPLGQRVPSDQVGPKKSKLKPNQSADLVEEVRRKADAVEGHNVSRPKTGEYDIAGPTRQPGKVARQSKLGTQPRKDKQGQYTQDNEEEPPMV